MLSIIRRSVVCRLDRHRPVRNRVKWDGERYVGTCEECGEPIHRLKRNTWR